MRCPPATGSNLGADLWQEACFLIDLHGLYFWIGIGIMCFSMGLIKYRSVIAGAGTGLVCLVLAAFFSRLLIAIWSWLLPEIYWHYYAFLYQLGPLLIILIGFSIYSTRELTGVLE